MIKKIHYLLLFTTLFAFLSSLYMQYVMQLMPCPLCLMQRLCVFLLLMVLAFNLRTFKKGLPGYIGAFLISVAGLFFALRQVWLQSLPENEVPACMPGLDILIRYFPWQAVLKSLVWGTGDCAEKIWNLWHISLAGWSALYFLLIGGTSLILWFSTRYVKS